MQHSGAPSTLPRVLAAQATRLPDAEAVVDGEVRLTFAGLAAAVTRLAAGLLALGVAAGERVAIQAPNRWEWIVAALAVHQVGAVLVPLNTRFRGEESVDILARARVTVLFAAGPFLGTDYIGQLAATGAPLPDLRGIIRLPTTEGTDETRVPWPVWNWGAVIEAGAAVPPETVRDAGERVSPGDFSDILYTSGTTGRPKGVPTTHAQTVEVYTSWASIVGLGAGDRYLLVPPFFHCFGYKAGWLACLLTGAVALPHLVFDAASVAARIGPDRISVLTGPPALFQALLDRTAATTPHTLRLAVTGAAVVPVELVRRMKTDLGCTTVLTAYGLTESSGVATMCRQEDDPETIATTSGRAIPGVEVRVVDATGTPLPVGEPGEVLVRGDNVMHGYLDDPAATAATVDAAGWLHTGDIGILDARGYLRITDRLKDMYTVGGFKAWPAEIERVLLTHPDIADAAVVGMPDDRLGEVGCAFLVWRGAIPDAEALTRWCRERMANYKVPRRFVGVETLPRNASGKVLKPLLRERTCSGG